MATQTTNPTAQKLLELERQYWQALKDRDAGTAMRLSDDPCIVAGAQGVTSMDRATLGKMMSSATYRLREFKLSDEQVKLLGDDVAIVAYKVREELDVEGQPLTLEATDTSTWVKRNGSWVCTLHTEALSGDPFGRDRVKKQGPIA